MDCSTAPTRASTEPLCDLGVIRFVLSPLFHPPEQMSTHIAHDKCTRDSNPRLALDKSAHALRQIAQIVESRVGIFTRYFLPILQCALTIFNGLVENFAGLIRSIADCI